MLSFGNGGIDIDPLTLFLLTMAGRAVEGGLGAFGASQANQREAQRAENQRAANRQAISILEDPNILPLIDAASRTLTQSLEANSIRSGGINDGVSRARENDLSADIAARLAQTLIGIEQQNNQSIAQLLTDPAFSVEDPDSFNLGLDTFLGAILGAGGGAVEASGLAFDSDSFRDPNAVPPAPRTRVIPPNTGLSFGTEYNFGNNVVDPVSTNLILAPFQ